MAAKVNLVLDDEVREKLEALVPAGERNLFVNEALRARLNLFKRQRAVEQLESLRKRGPSVPTVEVVQALGPQISQRAAGTRKVANARTPLGSPPGDRSPARRRESRGDRPRRRSRPVAQWSAARGGHRAEPGARNRRSFRRPPPGVARSSWRRTGEKSAGAASRRGYRRSARSGARREGSRSPRPGRDPVPRRGSAVGHRTGRRTLQPDHT